MLRLITFTLAVLGFEKVLNYLASFPGLEIQHCRHTEQDIYDAFFLILRKVSLPIAVPFILVLDHTQK